MKNEITISELAKLMHVSVHQIRYFEEKGALTPAYTDSNQYRMYGIDEIYRLAHILLLRRLGIPVNAIQGCTASSSPEQGQHLVQQALLDVRFEIRRLQELEQLMTNILNERHSADHSSNPYLQRRRATYLTRWMRLEPLAKLTARQLVDQGGSVPNLFETDIHYIEDESGAMNLYTETEAPGDYSLPEGEYLSARMLIREESELEPLVTQFYDYAGAHDYRITGPLIVIERSYLSLFSPDKLHYELLARLDPGAPAERRDHDDDRADHD